MEHGYTRYVNKGCRCDICKAARAAYMRLWRGKNIERNRENDRNSKRKVALWLKEYKESHPCTDCGQFFLSVVMDFDHVKGEKLFNIGPSVNSYSRTRILTEIEKCELVCANCHRIRTYLRHLDV